MRLFIILATLGALLASCGKSGVETRKQSFLHKGNLAVNDRRFKDAERFYREAIGLDSNYTEALNNLGIVLEKQGKNAAALKSFNSAVHSDSTFYDAFFNRANLLVDLGQDSLALVDLRHVGGKLSKKAQIAFLVGMAYFHLKQYPEASAAFGQSTKLDSSNAENYINLGTVQFYQGEYGQARENIQQGLAIDPKEANGYNVLGLMDIKDKDFAGAEKDFDEALQRDPENPYFLNNRGYLYLLDNKLEQGFKDITLSMALKPQNAWAYRNKGFYFLKKGENAQALDLLKHAKELDPSLELVNFYLGNAYNALGDRPNACACWKRSADLGEQEGIAAWSKNCGRPSR